MKSEYDPPIQGRVCSVAEGRVQVTYRTLEAVRVDAERALRHARVTIEGCGDLGVGDPCNLILQLPVVGRIMTKSLVAAMDFEGGRTLLEVLEPEMVQKALLRAVAPPVPPPPRSTPPAPSRVEPPPPPPSQPLPSRTAQRRAAPELAGATQRVVPSRTVPQLAVAAADGFLRTFLQATQRAKGSRDLEVRAVMDSLREATMGSGELEVVRAEDGLEVSTGGISSFRVPLLETLRGPDAGQIAARYDELFDKNDMVVLRIGHTCTRDEVSAVTELLGRPLPSTVSADERSKRLARSLHEKRVSGIVIEFGQEVVGREGQLPWRVRMVIQRLRRDLRSIPLIRDAGLERLAEVRIQTVADVMRAVGDAETYTMVLEHAELIEAASADAEDLRGTSITRIVTALIPERFITDVAAQLSSVVASSRAAQVALSELCGRLLAEHSRQAHAVLRLIREHVDPTSMPVDLAQWIAADELCERLGIGVEPPSIAAEEEDQRDGALRVRGKAVRILIGDDKLRDAARLLDHTFLEAPTAQELYDALLIRIFSQEVIDQLCQRLGAREQRDAAVTLLRYSGPRCVAPLLTCVRESEERVVRELAMRLIVERGDAAQLPVLHALAEEEVPWYVTRNMLVLATTLSFTEATPDARRHLGHAHGRVREAALSFLIRMQGEDTEDLLLEALSDGTQAVRVRAAAGLVALGCALPRALAGYLELVAVPDARRAEAHIFSALRIFLQLSDEDRRSAGELERTLVERMVVWAQLGEAAPTDRVLIATCQLMALVGTRRALYALRAMSSARSGHTLGLANRSPDRDAETSISQPVVLAALAAISAIEAKEGKLPGAAYETTVGRARSPDAASARPLSSRVLDERVGKAVLNLGAPKGKQPPVGQPMPSPRPEPSPHARRIMPPKPVHAAPPSPPPSPAPQRAKPQPPPAPKQLPAVRGRPPASQIPTVPEDKALKDIPDGAISSSVLARLLGRDPE